MVLFINNVDYSNYIMQENCTEAPEYFDGPGAGLAINGNAIFDRVGVRVGTTYKLKPMPQSMYAALFAASKQNSVSVRYTSFLSSSEVTDQAQIALGSLSYATVSGGERIYYGATITITPKTAL